MCLDVNLSYKDNGKHLNCGPESHAGPRLSHISHNGRL